MAGNSKFLTASDFQPARCDYLKKFSKISSVAISPANDEMECNHFTVRPHTMTLHMLMRLQLRVCLLRRRGQQLQWWKWGTLRKFS